jgi:Alpha-galactosidase
MVSPEIRAPRPPQTPRINGAPCFGVTPGAPFLYTIPASGLRPMTFSAAGLPPGLSIDSTTGRIHGSTTALGEHAVTLRASNTLGSAEKSFRIVVGDTIALTPPMGWNSWNCWAYTVDQDKVLRSAKALVSAGLADHGWSYINIDDTWQGERGGPHFAIQPNEKFPDLKKLCDEIHALGLKAGIYSSPWITTYGGYRGGSSDSPNGAWEKLADYECNKRLGKFRFAANDARQFAEWGFDYLKYDWHPNDIDHTREMAEALLRTGRDIVLSLSNSAPFADAAELSSLANAWRTTGDIVDVWTPPTPQPWQFAVSEIGFNQDAWAPFSRPGHWNDPDMLVLGWVGWGPQLHATRLTPAEQYSHFSLWCLLAAPLLIGCDLERLDDFTLGLLTNDEVIAVNQDALGLSARRVATIGVIDVFKKPLEDGSCAVGLFNRGEQTRSMRLRFDRIGLATGQSVRDLWRQHDLGDIDGEIALTIAAHDVELLRLTPRAA